MLFEVFAEAYFAIQATHQAQEIWPEKELPQKIRDQLGIPIDAGVDGVIKTRPGLFIGYQVKFRTGRPALTWDSDGLAKFFGQTDRCDQRILITNSTDLSHITNDRILFSAIKGNDLDRLDASNFETIQNWLETGVVHHEKSIPMLHQKNAISAIVNTFKQHDRAKAIMACGTGKTLVALWAAEEMKAKNILILLPSLALVKQTLHSWAQENNLGDSFTYFGVCSDQTVKKDIDEIILKKHDLDFSITTDVDKVKSYLQYSNLSHKIIFSTYQSSHVVAQAMPEGFVFDLAIFDEAHKTASRTETKYAFALEDKNIAIKKRLFLTATPRHYNINKKDREGDQKIVFSMDDETVYGPDAYKLSFKEAIASGFICEYKVLVSVITSEDIKRTILSKVDITDINGEVIKAEKIANLLAIQQAVNEYNMHHIISFHSSIPSAASFTKIDEGIGTILPEFTPLHVKGAMPTSMRDSIIKEFKEADKSIISNARCLTEGVDIPAVDMVVFMTPKKSRVDIIQATGRAMRIPRDKKIIKKCGYVLLPLYIEQKENETIEQALDKTQFDEIWDVLNAIQEHDESLAEIINQMREDKGRGLGFNDSRLREKVEVLAPKFELNKLRDAITVRMIERLGSNWDDRFGELVRYKEENGHLLIPYINIENQALNKWVIAQRALYKSKSPYLTEERIARLNQIGFIWDINEILWNKHFYDLCEYKQNKGHCNVPKRYLENSTLAGWVGHQRGLYKNNKLSMDRIIRLNEIGFDWRIQLDKPNYLKMLKEFKQKSNHCIVPQVYPENQAFARWVGVQRMHYKKGLLTSSIIDELNQIGFIWDPSAASWEEKYLELYEFKKNNGHCDIPWKDKAYLSLARWINKQREYYKKNLLGLERINQLENIGCNLNPIGSLWEKRYIQLCEFKNQYGHCNVPLKYSENSTLGMWVHTQRHLYRSKSKRLTIDRINKLNKIGFVWTRGKSS